GGAHCSAVYASLERVTRPVSGHRRDEPRACLADASQGAWPLEESAAAQGSGAAAPAGDRTREEARLLHPCGGLAARRPRALRPRDALGGDAAAPGLLPTE